MRKTLMFATMNNYNTLLDWKKSKEPTVNTRPGLSRSLAYKSQTLLTPLAKLLPDYFGAAQQELPIFLYG